MEKDLPPVEIRFQLKATLEDSYLIRFLGTLMKKVVGERVSAENCDRIAKGARLMIIGERWNHSPNEPNPNVAKMIRNEKPDLSEVHIDEIIRLLRLVPFIEQEYLRQRLVKIRDGIDPGPLRRIKPDERKLPVVSAGSEYGRDGWLALENDHRSIRLPAEALAILFLGAVDYGWKPPHEISELLKAGRFDWNGVTFTAHSASELAGVMDRASRESDAPTDQLVSDLCTFFREGRCRLRSS